MEQQDNEAGQGHQAGSETLLSCLFFWIFSSTAESWNV